jgi:hypothetical protein
VAFWTLHLHLFAAFVAVNIKKSWLVTKYAVHVQRLSASWTDLIVPFHFCLTFRASDIDRGFFTAEGTYCVLGHYKL